ncbi:MAG: redox-sensing transcriptional repressor Rex [Bacteroidales bacterium]|nr:redox-sensing transcriptional repressor Rex [Bacteroidales bacterium]
MDLPPRTVKRLSQYRRLLEKYKNIKEAHIFSHDLALQLNLTPVQVRRDMMLIGLSGNHRKGYNIQELVTHIGSVIDHKKGYNIAIIGMGNLGSAISTFIRNSNTQMNVVAGFDVDAKKINRKVAGIECFSIKDIRKKVDELNIHIAILTLPMDVALDTAHRLIHAGVKGILNFTSMHLDLPAGIYIKNYDIITSLEEIGFFIKAKD